MGRFYKMSEIKLVKDYKNSEKYRLSFNELAKNTFGIDFETWFQNGFWNDRYIGYAYVDGDQVVANISISLMDIIWEGQKKRALQIGTVMTHTDYRKRGLASSLMKIILEENEKNFDFIYLFANDQALDFYLKFGFQPISESKFSMGVEFYYGPVANLRKLDISKVEDLKLISDLAAERRYISEKLGVFNDKCLIMFYCLFVYSEDIYYLEEEDSVVIFKTCGSELNLYDVLSKKNIDVEDMISKIATPEVSRVVFHFTPDLKSGQVDIEELVKSDCTLLIKPLSKEITKEFQFPATSHA